MELVVRQPSSPRDKKPATPLEPSLNLGMTLARSLSSKPLASPKEGNKVEIPKSCSICFEEKFLYFLSECNHSFCKECLAMHLENAIIVADIPVNCPQQGCTKQIDETDIVKLVSLEIAAKYARFLRKLQTPEIRDCPKCGTMCKPQKNSEIENLVICEKCKLQFCMYHSNAHPMDVSCEDHEAALRRMGGDKTAKLLKNMKRCPNCGIPSERSDGCPMMTCPNCHSNWCYKCCGKVVGESEASLRCTKCGANAFRHNRKPTCLSCCCGLICSPCWLPCGLCYSCIMCPCACLCGEDCGERYMVLCCWFEVARDWFWCPWDCCCKDAEDYFQEDNEKRWNQTMYKTDDFKTEVNS